MHSLIQVKVVLLLGIANCRFVLSGDSNVKVDIHFGVQFADAKKILADILSKAKVTYVQQTGGTDKPVGTNCHNGWFKYEESCYLFDSKPLTFKTAEDECNRWGAHLVRLETNAENHFLKMFMANHFKKGVHYWIGMTDEETEGIWKISGTNKTVPFTDWQWFEPQNLGGKENCAVFQHYFEYRWADITCHGKFRAVCEKNSSSLISTMN